MRIFIVLSLFCISLAACTSFTTEKVMQLHQGMSSNEILAMFGEPKNVRVSVCGKEPNTWACTTWEYEDVSENKASFTFAKEKDGLILNNFNIDRTAWWE